MNKSPLVNFEFSDNDATIQKVDWFESFKCTMRTSPKPQTMYIVGGGSAMKKFAIVYKSKLDEQHDIERFVFSSELKSESFSVFHTIKANEYIHFRDTLRIINLQTQEETCLGPSSYISETEWYFSNSKNKEFLVSRILNKRFEIWDWELKKMVFKETVRGDDYAGFSLLLNEKTEEMLLHMKNTIKVWDLKTYKEIRTINIPSCHAIKYINKGKTIIALESNYHQQSVIFNISTSTTLFSDNSQPNGYNVQLYSETLDLIVSSRHDNEMLIQKLVLGPEPMMKTLLKFNQFELFPSTIMCVHGALRFVFANPKTQTRFLVYHYSGKALMFDLEKMMIVWRYNGFPFGCYRIFIE